MILAAVASFAIVTVAVIVFSSVVAVTPSEGTTFDRAVAFGVDDAYGNTRSSSNHSPSIDATVLPNIDAQTNNLGYVIPLDSISSGQTQHFMSFDK